MAMLLGAAALSAFLLSDKSGAVWRNVNLNALPAHLRGHIPKLLTGTKKSFSEQDLKDLNLGGKVVVITGSINYPKRGQRGRKGSIGYHTALALASRKATVIITGRNKNKGDRAAKKIREDIWNTFHQRAQVIFIPLDLSDFKSIIAFRSQLEKSQIKKIDSLICNAAIRTNNFSQTEQGIESQFGINYVSHFLLTNSLLPFLETAAASNEDYKASTVVFVSSNLHYKTSSAGVRGMLSYNSKLNPGEETIDPEIGKELVLAEVNHAESFEGLMSYAESKLALTMYAKELGERLLQQNKRLPNPEDDDQDTPIVLVNSVHPGFVNSGLYRETGAPFEGLGEMFDPIKGALLDKVGYNANTAAMNLCFLAFGIPVLNTRITGEYFHPIGLQQTPSEFVGDAKMRKGLWDLTEKIIESKLKQ